MKDSKNWYYQVNSELSELSRQHNLSMETVVGIFVTLSAQTPYDRNMELTKRYLSSGKLDGMMVSQTKKDVCKAILAGNKPLESWAKTSHKYINFYNSIMLIDGSICIDTHIINMYLENHPYSRLFNYNISSIFKSKRLLEPIYKWIKRQAEQQQLKTFEMQSVLWVEYRGKMW